MYCPLDFITDRQLLPPKWESDYVLISLKGGETEGESVCVCVGVGVREREREKELCLSLDQGKGVLLTKNHQQSISCFFILSVGHSLCLYKSRQSECLLFCLEYKKTRHAFKKCLEKLLPP